jgi:L-lysine 6-transaminase
MSALFMQEPLPDIGVLDSTWGGGLPDMVRFCHEREIVEQEGLVKAAATGGILLADRLRALQTRFPPLLRNVRGMGLYSAKWGKGTRLPGKIPSLYAG